MKIILASLWKMGSEEEELKKKVIEAEDHGS